MYFPPQMKGDYCHLPKHMYQTETLVTTKEIVKYIH